MRWLISQIYILTFTNEHTIVNKLCKYFYDELLVVKSFFVIKLGSFQSHLNSAKIQSSDSDQEYFDAIRFSPLTTNNKLKAREKSTNWYQGKS